MTLKRSKAFTYKNKILYTNLKIILRTLQKGFFGNITFFCYVSYYQKYF